MGEILKNIKEIKLGEGKFLIEQNAPHARGDSNCIHLQNEKFRMEMAEPVFLKIVGAILWSRKNFDFMKGCKSK